MLEKKKDIAFRYDSSADIYDNRYEPIQEKKYQEIFSRVDANFNKEKILDAGCGTGTFLNIIKNSSKDNGNQLVGIDLSTEMIKKAHEKYPEISFVVADSDNLPFRDNVFDKIFSVTHLQNLPEPEFTVKEMHRIAVKEAIFAVSILRKTWSNEKLYSIFSENNFTILDEWQAELEDIGIICHSD
ncbi:MAG: class I SAM-dependent methyltransferase [Candidatus Heimdallarchaeota archaeon]